LEELRAERGAGIVRLAFHGILFRALSRFKCR
jgi:hypothetical protein